MSMIAKTSERLDEAGEVVLRGINVMFLLAILVGLVCAVVLMGAATYGILHNGNDFTWGGNGGFEGGGDMITLPSLLS